MKEIQNVTIVGAGTMGHSLAQVFAQSGYKVRLNDVQEEILSKAEGLIAANLQTLVELGFLEQKDAAATLSRILTTSRIEEAGRDADFVIEAITEDQNAKKEIFKTLDRVCPDPAILASNTSYLDIFKFVETRRPDKVLITHWFAPPHIVPLVEIVHGSQTSSETIQAIKALLIKVGKMPIVIFKISSRVYCQSDIDKATKTSFGLRMPIVGLVKRFDFAGLDLSQKVLRNPSTRDSRAKQGAAFANRFSWDRRLLEEDKKSFRGHPHDQHESRRSHCEAL